MKMTKDFTLLLRDDLDNAPYGRKMPVSKILDRGFLKLGLFWYTSAYKERFDPDIDRSGTAFLLLTLTRQDSPG